MNKVLKPKTTLRDMAYISLCSALIAGCSWISIPAVVPFTMQTCGVFLSVGLLGGRRGAWSVLVYILLGAVGLPVFSGGTGGLGVLLGPTGGYIIGFLGAAVVMWLGEPLAARRRNLLILLMLSGLFVCYALGTAWFLAVYSRGAEGVGVAAVLGWCVFPFIIPDLAKIALAALLVRRLERHIAA